MSHTKLNGQYKAYDFGNRKKTRKSLLKEFDEKLELVIDKIRKEGTKEQQECIGLYRSRADELRATIKAMPRDCRDVVEMLGRSIQTLEDGLKGVVDEENNQQSLLLARDLGREANTAAAECAFFGFLAVTFTVIALVFAIPSAGISLLVLLELVPTGVGIALSADVSHQASEAKEKVTSFTDTSHGLFSGDAMDGQPEGEAEQKPSYDKKHDK
ncbi:MAG: hypothetical protein K0U37_09055 [Gammaproteobacteria bacterium]|nr:hypothetical protein [Gammaproteobacteria bacterium]